VGELAGAVGRAGLRAGGNALGMTGRFVQRHPRLALGALAGTAAAGTVGAEGVRRSNIGLTPQWQAARRAGYVQQATPSGTWSRFNVLKNRQRLARQLGQIGTWG
jgi:uncharacterized protein YfiM (DUF2279 family)